MATRKKKKAARPPLYIDCAICDAASVQLNFWCKTEDRGDPDKNKVHYFYNGTCRFCRAFIEVEVTHDV